MKSTFLLLSGIFIGCAAATVSTLAPSSRASAAAAPGAVEQYCTSTGDFNNVKALDSAVKQAGLAGWELIGVYRPSPVGSTYEDYICFRRPK